MFKREKRIIGATGINLAFNFLGKGLNYFALSILVAYFFGASWKTDSYVMGGIIPFWIMTVILCGFNSCLIPVFIYYKNKVSDENAQQMLAAFCVVSILGLSIIVVLGIISASFLIPIYSPGFDSAGHKLAVSISRWIFLSLIFNFLANFISSIFYSYHKYIIPAIGNVALPLMIIINLVIFSKRIGIFSLITGLFCGQLLQISWMLVHIKKIYHFGKLKWDFKHPGIKKTLNLFIPIAIGASIYPLFIIITRILASTLGEGMVAIFEFATKIVLGIMLTISTAICISILPTLSEIELIKERNMEELNRVISLGISILSFFLVPIAFMLIALKTPIVRLLLERGAFHFGDSIITAQVLQFLAIIMLIEPFIAVFTQVMFALKDTRRLLISTSIGVFVNILSALVLVKPLGIKGLALSFPIGIFVQVIVLFFITKSKLKYNDEKSIIIPYAKVFSSAGIMVLLIKFSSPLIRNIYFFDNTKLNLLFSTGISVLIGGIIYIFCLYLLKFPELKLIWSIIREKVKGGNHRKIA